MGKNWVAKIGWGCALFLWGQPVAYVRLPTTDIGRKLGGGGSGPLGEQELGPHPPQYRLA